MRQLVVLSGKGGTGKTTVTAGLAHLAAHSQRLILVDADVDAPNLEIILQPEIEQEERFVGGQKAKINPSTCISCGACYTACRFGAIASADNTYEVQALFCEGCAACYYVCPSGAIRMQESEGGRWFKSRTRYGTLFHARLAAGAENSGKMVSTLRQQASLFGHEQGVDLALIDGSPGIGCPVIAAATGVDLALIISEPTLSGARDLERALDICRHLHVHALVSINKADINPRLADTIAERCEELGVPMSPRIPYDDVVSNAVRQGRAITEYSANPVADAIRRIWDELQQRLAAS
ncbi:MAG: ATP-binding protein [Chloroflexi bacterium]|nr:ATP-binding protein [Chloroflexota bacterium]